MTAPTDDDYSEALVRRLHYLIGESDLAIEGRGIVIGMHAELLALRKRVAELDLKLDIAMEESDQHAMEADSARVQLEELEELEEERRWRPMSEAPRDETEIILFMEPDIVTVLPGCAVGHGWLRWCKLPAPPKEPT